MMDVIMAAILLLSFGLVKLFADFCDHEIESKER